MKSYHLLYLELTLLSCVWIEKFTLTKTVDNLRVLYVGEVAKNP